MADDRTARGMRLLALDVGERRIGLASGVSETETAFPAGVVRRRTRLAQDTSRTGSLLARQLNSEGPPGV